MAIQEFHVTKKAEKTIVTAQFLAGILHIATIKVF